MDGSRGARRYGKEYLLWQSTVAIKSLLALVKNGDVVQRVNKILVGRGNYFQCGYPKRAFDKVNWYVRNRLYLHFNRKSQRGYVLKYAPKFYSELQAMGLHRLLRRRK